MTYLRTRSRKLLLGLGLALLCTGSVANARQSQAPHSNPVKGKQEKINPVKGTEEKFERGVVIDRVVSTGDPTKSYALYLPTAYAADTSNNGGGASNAIEHRNLSQPLQYPISDAKAATGRRTPKFPIIYCFDPMARGAVPVERF